MTSWLYVFSKLTPEALLFETLIICFLCASYALFWILRKRRLGSTEEVVPVGVIKSYLNELIVDAESVRGQLFGLLQGTGAAIPVTPGVAAAPAPTPVPAAEPVPSIDPELLKDSPEIAAKVAELEKRLGEQTSALEGVVSEKARLEQELAQAKSAAEAAGANAGGEGAAAAPAEGGGAPDPELQKRVKELEARLAEYSVIEDDLANLKRLQQENAKLKEMLEKGGGSADAAAAEAEPEAKDAAESAAEELAAAAEPAAEPAAEEPAAEAEKEAAPEAAAEPAAEEKPEEAAAEEAAAAEPEATPETPQAAEPEKSAMDMLEEADQAAETKEEPPAGAEAATNDAPAEGGDFENLVDQVEASISDEGSSDKPAEASAKEEASTSEDNPDNMNQSDADLLSEFEKMLNS